MGALCFLGRIEEGICYYNRVVENLSSSQKISCRFFLSIGCTRLAHKEEAVAYLVENLKQLRLQPSDRDRFYIYQGLAFYRNLGCRYRSSLEAADKAWKAAVSANFLWGRILAADLKGHGLLHTGQMNLGIASLKRANRIASKVGNKGLSTATEYSIAYATANTGSEPHETVDRLVKSLEQLAPEDSYSRIGLLIDLGRELSLEGDSVNQIITWPKQESSSMKPNIKDMRVG